MSTSSSEIRKHLSALPFWGALTARERETMEACAQIRSYAKDALIYSKEQECLGLIRVLTGTVRTFMLSPEGREIRLYRVGQGETGFHIIAVVQGHAAAFQGVFRNPLVNSGLLPVIRVGKSIRIPKKSEYSAILNA